MMTKVSSISPTTRRDLRARMLVILALLLVLGLAIGCNKVAGRSDAQIASDVQTKVLSDPNVPTRQISVQAQNGVVTLAGNVTSDQERAAAAAAAAQVEGVKTVVNNLQVTPSANAQTTPPPQQQEQQQAAATAPPEPVRESRRSAQHATSTRGTGRKTIPDYSDNQQSSSTSSTSTMASNTTPMPSTPSAPPVPQKVTIPDGTTIAIRLIDSLDSERNQVGDSFRATLSSPLVVNDEVVLPADADVEGRVVDVKSAGRFAGASALTIELTKISVNGRAYPIHTNQWSKQGRGEGRSTATKVGGGAALGAIIGGLAGGGKGAAIGATVGAGAGTGVSAAGKGQQIKLNSEALLTFQLQSPITVLPVSQVDRSRRND